MCVGMNFIVNEWAQRIFGSFRKLLCKYIGTELHIYFSIYNLNTKNKSMCALHTYKYTHSQSMFNGILTEVNTCAHTAKRISVDLAMRWQAY